MPVSLVNHYEILGLHTGAGQAEIKTAFRRLAKIYHPDKNPEGKEHFSRILKAYEILSDPSLKSTYDYKLNYHFGREEKPAARSTSSTTKTWHFDEKEVKHRQYYSEHYKKNSKTTAQYTAEVETKKSYNEYKYILFATPIAVALFLLIMKLAMPEHPPLTRSPVRKEEPVAPKEMRLHMGDMPYAAFFGGAKYDTAYKQQLRVNNETGREVIVCLFTKTEFIRSFYIHENYFAEVSQLPDTPLFIRYTQGSNFKLDTGSAAALPGGFTKAPSFFKSRNSIVPHASASISLHPIAGKQFNEIDAGEFFKLINNHHDKKN